MLKKITEPQAIYQKQHQDGAQPVHTTLTTPPKKRSKLSWKIISSIVTVSLVVVVGIAGVLIAQRQQQVEGPVAPNAPESRPEAATGQACTLSFEITATPTVPPTTPPAPGAVKCISKTAARISGQAAPLPANSKVRQGDRIEYTITFATLADTTRVTITDTLPAQLKYVTGQAKVDGVVKTVQVSGNTITLNLDIPAASRNKQMKFTYQADVIATTASTFTNSAKIMTNNSTALNSSCSLPLAVEVLPTGVARCESKVAINPVTKKAYTTTGTTVSTVKRGETIEYKLSVSAEKTTKGAVVLTDVLPAQLEYVTGSATGVTTQPTVATANNRTTLTFNLGTMAASGTKQTFTITYKATVKANAQIAPFSNDAKVITAADTTTTSACKATLSVHPVGVAQCAEKTTLSATGSVLANESIVKKGDIVTYRIKVTATESTNGPVAVSDVLPTSVSIVQPLPQGINYNTATRTVTSTIGVMGDTAANREKTIEFKVKVNDNAPAGDFVNTAVVTTSGANANSCPATLRLAYACNTNCTTDAQCASSGNTNLVCSQEAGNKCRLANNTSSESCEGQSISYSCNSSCSTDDQCKTANSNFVCAPTSEGQRCRLSGNEQQANCQAVSTPTPTPTIGCNQACTSNADCTNPNHICYTTGDGSQLCRLDANPTSASCTTGTTAVATATPQPEMPQELPQSGPEDWVNWLKAGLITLGIGAILLLLL